MEAREHKNFKGKSYKVLEASDLHQNQQNNDKISFQIPSLDKLLNGGLNIGSINEIYGEAGSGKSQLAKHLCLVTQLPTHLGGLNKKSLYISTDGPWSSTRLGQMAKTLNDKFKTNYAETVISLDKVLYISVSDAKSLNQLFETRIPLLLETQPIGLIVIDSVAAVYRTEKEYILRANDLRNLALALTHLSVKYNFGVLCINQVTSNPMSELSEDKNTAAALGVSWANLVTTRLKVCKVGSVPTSEEGIYSQERILKVMWSPDVRNDEATFFITADGIA